jgi:ribose transport system ATP-binding protein
MDDLALEMRGITKVFPGVVALDSVDFSARQGEIHALVGENGAGKSTLIKILSGVYGKDAGDIRINGQEVDISTPQDARLFGVSTIYQELNLVPFLDATANMWVGREDNLGSIFLNKTRMRAESEEIIERLEVDLPLNVPVKHLSVVQQQMVAIARALAEDARILVMDEPTARLAAHEIERLFDTARRLIQQGVTIIYISHRLEEIFELANRITVLKDGRLQGTLDVEEASPAQIVRMMVGQGLEDRYYKLPVEPGSDLLVCEHLSDDTRLEDISFTLRSGEILGVVGPVGSGRTELAKAIFGANHIAKGSLTLEREQFTPHKPSHAIARGVAFVPEDRRGEGLIMHMEIAENITLPTLKQWSLLGFLQPARERRVAKGLAQKVDIRMRGIRQRVRYLSGGNQQKVVVARWLGKESKVFLLDEPTAGIDVGAKVEIYRLVAELVAQGAGVIFISSEIPEVLGIADRILVMRRGRIVAEFTRSEATEEKILAAVLAGQVTEDPADSQADAQVEKMI